MTTKFLRAKMMRVPYKHTVQQYLADLHLEDLSEHTIGGYAKVLRGFERFMCAGQPGAELLLSTITPNVGQCAQVSKQAYNRAIERTKPSLVVVGTIWRMGLGGWPPPPLRNLGWSRSRLWRAARFVQRWSNR